MVVPRARRPWHRIPTKERSSRCSSLSRLGKRERAVLKQNSHQRLWRLSASQLGDRCSRVGTSATLKHPQLHRLGCCSHTLPPVVASESSRPVAPSPFPAQSPFNENSSFHQLQGSLGRRPKASDAGPRVHNSRATGGARPPSPSSGSLRAREMQGPGRLRPFLRSRGNSRSPATGHSVQARARVVTATDSGLTLKVWHRPLSPAVPATTHATRRSPPAARSWSLSSRSSAPQPMEEQSGPSQWPPPK